MLETFFPGSSYKPILSRKLNIDSIKDYQENHNNKFPPDSNSCFKQFFSFLFNTPNLNIYNYDYQYYQIFTYRDFARNIIKKYRSQVLIVTKQFRIHHLNHETKYKIIDEIDKMYIAFNSYRMKGADISSANSSRRNSLNSSLSLTKNSFTKSSHCNYKGSILRDCSLKFSTARINGGVSPCQNVMLSLPPTPNTGNFRKKKISADLDVSKKSC